MNSLCDLFQVPNWENKVIVKIDGLLESFIGIRDPELGESHSKVILRCSNYYAITISKNMREKFKRKFFFMCFKHFFSFRGGGGGGGQAPKNFSEYGAFY